MKTTYPICCRRPFLMTLLMVGALLSIRGAQGQEERDREPAAREGGIPRRNLEGEREGEQGMEDGAPSTDDQSRIKELAPRIAPPRGDWKLGVWVYNTETGVVVTRVRPGSAAERRGLEPGDRIVTVGGYQVGFVGDLLYPLGYELQRQAGRRGQVLLLVQDVRNDQLVNIDLQLDGGGRPRPLPRERE